MGIDKNKEIRNLLEGTKKPLRPYVKGVSGMEVSRGAFQAVGESGLHAYPVRPMRKTFVRGMRSTNMFTPTDGAGGAN